jgi:hypothetical protein
MFIGQKETASRTEAREKSEVIFKLCHPLTLFHSVHNWAAEVTSTSWHSGGNNIASAPELLRCGYVSTLLVDECECHFWDTARPGFRVSESVCLGSWGSSVGITTGYGLDGREVGVRVPIGGNFSLHVVHAGSGAHPASCPVNTEDSFCVKRPGCEADRNLELAPS